MKNRKTQGEFALTSEFSDKQFTKYFRLNRTQFNDVHRLVQNSIHSERCNAKKPIGMEETLAVFLGYVSCFIFFNLNCLQNTTHNVTLMSGMNHFRTSRNSEKHQLGCNKEAFGTGVLQMEAVECSGERPQLVKPLQIF
jgi:hypothetical protein